MLVSPWMTGPSASTPVKVADLGGVSPPRLLFALLHQRFTGTLQLEQGDEHPGLRTIWFEGGMPVFTDWVDPTEVLGQVLVGIGSIDPGALEDALTRMTREPGLLGETLMKMKAIDAAQLRSGLMRQCARKLTRLFALREGQVTIAAHAHELDALDRVNVLELILSGVLRHYDATRISEELGPALIGPVQATAAFARYRPHFHFRDDDEPVLDALVAGTTLDELAHAGAKPLRAAQLIYLLWACQMLRTDAVRPTAPARAAGMGEEANGPSASGAASRVGPLPSSASRVGPLPASDVGSSPAGSRVGPLPAASSSRVGPLPAASSSSRVGPLPAAGLASAADSASGARILAGASASGAAWVSARSEADTSPEAFEAQLAAFEAKIRRRAHAFDLFGLPHDADRKAIRAAWADASRLMHPDALQARKLGHLRERVGAVFAALSEANATLSNPTSRDALRDKLARGEDPSAETDAAALARAAFESELIAKEADRFLKANYFDRALERYEAALALNPGEPDWRAASMWCRYCLSPRQKQDAIEAERSLAAICTEFPKLARAHYLRGLILRDLGNTQAALMAFEQAITHDPRLIDAERQARAIRLNAGQAQNKAASEKKGKGIMGFFKR